MIHCNSINYERFSFPLDLLFDGSKQTHIKDSAVDNMNQLIINIFVQNSIDISAVSSVVSPSVLRFEFIPGPDLKIGKIRSWEDKLNEALSDYGPVRLIAPVAGKGTIAVEVPRPDRQIVRLREFLESKEFQESKTHLPVALGIDSENNWIVADLAKMPHLLIAGAAGQGKSVLLNNIILSLLSRLSPVDLKLVLIDPIQVEFTQFDKIKDHYLLRIDGQTTEVITSVDSVPAVLYSICREVEVRYDFLRQGGCRSIWEYNQMIADGELSSDKHHHLPYIVVVIDEFADLKMKLGIEFERPMMRIVQRSRAVGIHVVIATQRPSSDVITGIIKANFPSRIAFRVISKEESRIILDSTGAVRLLGKGDMLFNNNGSIKRIQSCFVEADEIGNVCNWIKTNCEQPQPYQLPVTPVVRIVSSIGN